MRATVLAAASAVWGIAGFVLAGGALDQVNDDIAWLVTALTILGPLAALVGAWAIRQSRASVAVALLVVSLATPTYFAARTFPAIETTCEMGDVGHTHVLKCLGGQGRPPSQVAEKHELFCRRQRLMVIRAVGVDPEFQHAAGRVIRTRDRPFAS